MNCAPPRTLKNPPSPPPAIPASIFAGFDHSHAVPAASKVKTAAIAQRVLRFRARNIMPTIHRVTSIEKTR